MPKNLAGKRRKLTEGQPPYEVWTDPSDTWKFLIVKKNQADDQKAFAIWNVACVTPHETDLVGHDTYVSEIKGSMRLVWIDPEYQAALLEQNPGYWRTPGVENDPDGFKRYLS